jgi:hypothetical protein
MIRTDQPGLIAILLMRLLLWSVRVAARLRPRVLRWRLARLCIGAGGRLVDACDRLRPRGGLPERPLIPVPRLAKALLAWACAWGARKLFEFSRRLAPEAMQD